VFCKVDVTSEEQVDAAFAKARAAIGQERILVNCAGTGNAVKTASRDKTTGEIRTFRWPASTASSRSTWWAPSAASPSRPPAC
jgi:NAD(P)-dependent dehydrogenase (short-subunit alcohol dehydrogenase family)